MDDFKFCSRSIEDFRAHAFFGKTSTISGGTTRAQYDVGNEEMLILDEKRGKTFQRQITIIPADGVVASDEWQRAIINWLCDQRGEFILLRDKTRYRLAQFDGEAKFSRANWPHGALELTATMGAGVYSVAESATSLTVSSSASARVTFNTGEPRPIRVEITPSGGSISAVTISTGGKRVSMSGFTARSSIMIDQAAERAAVKVDGAPAFNRVTNWDKLVIDSGATVTVAITGSGSATAMIYARGRWHS